MIISIFLQILLTDYKKRLVATKDFFVNQSSNFLIQRNIRYIYLPKQFEIRLNEVTKNVKNIFENEEVVIYKVK